MSAREVQIWFQNRRQTKRRRSVANPGPPSEFLLPTENSGETTVTSASAPVTPAISRMEVDDAKGVTFDRRHSVNTLMNNIRLRDETPVAAVPGNPCENDFDNTGSTAQVTEPSPATAASDKFKDHSDAVEALIGLSRSKNQDADTATKEPALREGLRKLLPAEPQPSAPPQLLPSSHAPPAVLPPGAAPMFVPVPNGTGGYMYHPVHILPPQQMFFSPRPGAPPLPAPATGTAGMPPSVVVSHHAPQHQAFLMHTAGLPPLVPFITRGPIPPGGADVSSIGSGGRAGLAAGPALIGSMSAGPPPAHLFLQGSTAVLGAQPVHRLSISPSFGPLPPPPPAPLNAAAAAAGPAGSASPSKARRRPSAATLRAAAATATSPKPRRLTIHTFTPLIASAVGPASPGLGDPDAASPCGDASPATTVEADANTMEARKQPPLRGRTASLPRGTSVGSMASSSAAPVAATADRKRKRGAATLAPAVAAVVSTSSASATRRPSKMFSILDIEREKGGGESQASGLVVATAEVDDAEGGEVHPTAVTLPGAAAAAQASPFSVESLLQHRRVEA
ncbi:hypothetical protein HK405_008614 [Cladochytrium tenue]|nr:hypothetical protein HK405_008614 [Cladochytrium tenue]